MRLEARRSNSGLHQAEPPVFNPGLNAGALHHPNFQGQVNYQAWDQPAGDEEATAQTISLMSYFARHDAASPAVEVAAAIATRGAVTQKEKAASIWRWIKAHISYAEDSRAAAALAGLIPDAASAEVLIRPVDLLRMKSPAGDCDDFSMLAASMLIASGIRPYFKTIAADPQEPDSYSHVFVIAPVGEGGSAFALDCSHGPYPGWEAPTEGKTRVWDLSLKSQLNGLRAVDWGKLLQTGVETTSTILTQRLGVPPAGVYKGPDGTFYRQQPGESSLQFPGSVGTGPGIGTLALIFGGLILVMQLARSK